MFFVIESEATNGLGAVATVYGSAVEKRAVAKVSELRRAGRFAWLESGDTSPFPTPADLIMAMSESDAKEYQRRLASSR